MIWCKRNNFIALVVLLLLLLGDSRAESEPSTDPFLAGKEYMSAKKYPEAVTSFEEAIKADPGSVNAHVELARAYTLAGRRREGLRAMDAALKAARRESEKKRIREQRLLITETFYTNASFQHYQDGLNYLSSMKLRAAIEAFEQALAREQDNIVVLIGYARALQAVDDWKESINVLEQAHALDPDRLEARTLLAMALLNSNAEKTIQLLKPLLNDRQASEDVVTIYAQAVAKRGDRKAAISLLEVDLEKNQDRPQVLFWLGKFSAEAPENRWMARRHLQAFLLKADRLKDREDLQNLRLEAKRLLDRVDGELGISGAGN